MIFTWNLKNKVPNITKQKQCHTDTKNKLVVARGLEVGGGRGEVPDIVKEIKRCKLSVKKINELGDKKYSVGNIVKNKVISLYDNSN